jgi:alkylated DNA repair dioxygenase AlkB
MVYNGTSWGLNDWLWVPWFPLLTITTLTRAVEVGTHMGDLDVGEIFLNFILELKARVHAGVDLTHFIAFSENISADKETPRTTCGEPEASQAVNAQQGVKPSGSSATKKSLKWEHESIERETAKRARQAGRPPPCSLKESSERWKLLEIPEIKPNIYVDGADV